jgi:hypothetical protein
VSSLPGGCGTREQLNRIVLLAACAVALTACGGGSPASRSASTHHGTTTTSARSTAHTLIPAPVPTSSTVPGVTTTSLPPLTTTPTTAAASSGPTPAQTEIAQNGCLSMDDLMSVVNGAISENSAQPLQSMQSSDPDYQTIVNLALLNSVSAYEKLGTDAGPFQSDFAAAIQSTQFNTLLQLADTLNSDCNALSLPTSPSN